MWDRRRASKGPAGGATRRWLCLLGVAAAAGCGGDLAAGEPPVAGASAGATTSVSRSDASDASAAVADASVGTSAAAPPPDSLGDAGPASSAPPAMDERAEAVARWLPACGSGAAGAGPASSGGGAAAPTPSPSVPTLRVDAPEMTFPFEAVRRALRRGARKQVEACAAQAHQAGPEPGRIALTRFVVSPDGKIESADLQLGTGDEALDECLVTAMKKPAMPKLSQGRVTLSKVPIVLCPDGHTLLWPDLPKAPAPSP